jgi:ABC transport system ATP-binding/permease protein
MALLTLAQAQLAYGDVALLDNAQFALETKERVGLIGRNGAGKSSLLRILAGLEKPDDGVLQVQTGLRMVYVAQEPVLVNTDTVFDAVCRPLADLLKAMDDYMTGEGSVAQMEDWQTQIDAQDGWNWQQRVDETLHRLHLDGAAQISTLSGGKRKRVALAQALVMQPQVLLLDEPTNHLDLDSILWLEDLLLAFAGSLIVITHDRHFLNRVSTRIVELDRGHLLSYPGNFEQYQVQKEEQQAQESVLNARADKLLAQEEVWIRKGVEARRTRATARIVRLDRLREKREARRDAVGRVRLELAAGAPTGKIVAELDRVSFAFKDGKPGVNAALLAAGEQAPTKTIVRELTTTILRGDKIGFIGPNGAGKTTLLKLILGTLQPDSGTLRTGTNISVAYFDQMRDALDPKATLEDFISPGSEWIEIDGARKHVKSYLSDFLFSPARSMSPVSSLSGGERNRLLLARLFARPANVLVLDEPTNDLDMDTLELLEELLQSYSGTVFLVSHDRTFVNNVVTSTLVYEGQEAEGQWREFEGDMDDWLAQSKRSQAYKLKNKVAATSKPDATGADTAAKPSAAVTPAPQPQLNATKPKRKLSYKEQRELDELPGKLSALESEQSQIKAELGNGEIYANDPAKATQLAQRDAAIDDEMLLILERLEVLGA